MKPFRNLFQGRINRATYVTGILSLTFIVIISSVYLGRELAYPYFAIFLCTLIPLYALAFIYYYSLLIRRKHDVDVNKRPRWSTYYSDGFFLFYSLLWLSYIKGESEDNHYGSPPPKGINFYILIFGNKKE